MMKKITISLLTLLVCFQTFAQNVDNSSQTLSDLSIDSQQAEYSDQKNNQSDLSNDSIKQEHCEASEIQNDQTNDKKKKFKFTLPKGVAGRGDYAKGPLYGKNMYIPYLIYYNAPAISAQNDFDLAFEYRLSTYILQDFITYPANIPAGFKVGRDYLSSEYLALDYESYVSEFGFSFYLKKCVQFGIDMRTISYCGGFIDAIIEGFHKTFGFPNGGREYYRQNVLKINVRNNNGIKLQLDDYCTSFGDIDFWVKWTFFKHKYVTLATLGAFKIPTGQLAKLSGSGYHDIATGLLVDVTPCRYVSIYSQSIFVLPFDSFLPCEQTPYPMYNMIITLEVHPLKCFSILGAFSFKTPAIAGESDKSSPYYFPHQRFDPSIAQPFFSYPQTNVLVGFEWKYKNFTWQFYFEEEPFFWQGVDITLNCMFKHTIDFSKISFKKKSKQKSDDISDL